MIRFTIDARLLALPRPGQLTIETVRESMERTLANPRLHPDMRASTEATLAEWTEAPAQIGRDANGTEFTMLRVEHEGRRLEVSAADKLAHRAVAEMAVGETYRLTVELLGEEPHYRMRLAKFAEASA